MSSEPEFMKDADLLRVMDSDADAIGQAVRIWLDISFDDLDGIDPDRDGTVDSNLLALVIGPMFKCLVQSQAAQWFGDDTEARNQWRAWLADFLSKSVTDGFHMNLAMWEAGLGPDVPPEVGALLDEWSATQSDPGANDTE